MVAEQEIPLQYPQNPIVCACVRVFSVLIYFIPVLLFVNARMKPIIPWSFFG